VRYFGTQEGAGSDFGGFVIWDVSGRPCRLTKYGTITPSFVSGSGRPFRFRLDPPIVLSARATEPHEGGAPRGVVEASFSMSGEYRDGAGPRGLCSRRHEVVPARWLFRDGTLRLSVANGRPESRSMIPDGAHPSSGLQPQPVEACGHHFRLAYVGRY
jgi:hypothetical protein